MLGRLGGERVGVGADGLQLGVVHALDAHRAQAVERLRAAQDAGQRIVISRRHRIELVVVAARAGDGQPEERPPDDFNLLVNHVHAEQLALGLLQCLRAQRQKARGHDPRVPLRSRARQQITGNLLPDELVVRQVEVERADDPVAVTPRVVPGHVAGLAVGLGVARQVQPVPAPAFAEVRGSEQFVHQNGDGGSVLAGGGAGPDKGLNFLGRWRQADEVVMQPADKRARIGNRDGLQTLLLQLREDEAVHGGARPRGGLHGGHRRRFNRLEGPERAGVFKGEAAGNFGAGRLGFNKRQATHTHTE